MEHTYDNLTALAGLRGTAPAPWLVGETGMGLTSAYWGPAVLVTADFPATAGTSGSQAIDLISNTVFGVMAVVVLALAARASAGPDQRVEAEIVR